MEEIGGIPVVISRGTPYQIGQNHGKAQPQRVQRSFECNLKSCLDTGLVSEKEIFQIATGYIKQVERYNQDYLEEIQGIADGAGMRLEELMVLNCRTELQKISQNPQQECTAIAVAGERTVDGATYIGQNWDTRCWAKECLIYHIIEQQNGKPAIAYCGEAGIICRSGINSVGIGDAVNSLSTDAPVNLEGVPLQFLLRGVLDADNLGAAIDAVNGGKNAAVNNIMIAQRDHEIADVEMDTGCCGMMYPTDGILVHANHYVCAGHPRYPHVDRSLGNSFVRHNRSEKLMRMLGPVIGIDDIKRVFSDHGDAPQCICRHLDQRYPWECQGITVFSFIGNLTTLEMELAPHNPCQGYLKIRPFELLNEKTAKAKRLN